MNAIERVLALAFIAAVCLNFANVVGRYGFGYSMAAADELQIYVMVFMAFLGAAVVAWRREHLRMDVLARFLPENLQAWTRGFETLCVVVLAAFVVVQSSRYAWQMYVLDRRSDNAGIPTWIPHSAVALGFLLVALAALVRFFKPSK